MEVHRKHYYLLSINSIFTIDFFLAWAISDHEIIFVSNTDPTGIWSFTLDYGFRKISDLSASHLEGGSTLLPKHTIKC